MLIVNINGPINAGKSTVSRLLSNKLKNSLFIEVDDLLSDKEQEDLGLNFRGGIKERLKRLNQKITELKKTSKYEIILFAYPLDAASYKRWSKYTDEKTTFINITLSPKFENCIKNRGTRKLDDWEMNRIKEMYSENFHCPTGSDFIINNDNQTPEETANIIVGFIAHIQNPSQQWVHLVDRRWSALLDGSKTDTLRLNEGFIHKGFLLYRSCSEQHKAIVYITGVYYIPLRETLKITGTDERTPDEATLLKQLQVHYPNITLDTHLLLATHLSVPETLKKYSDEVKRILAT